MNTETQIQILIKELYRLQNIHTNLVIPIKASFDNYNHVIKALADTHPEMLGNNLPLNEKAILDIEETFTNLREMAISLNDSLPTPIEDRILKQLTKDHTLEDIHYLDIINQYDFKTLFGKGLSWQEKKRNLDYDPLICITAKHEEVFYSKKAVSKWWERNTSK